MWRLLFSPQRNDVKCEITSARNASEDGVHWMKGRTNGKDQVICIAVHFAKKRVTCFPHAYLAWDWLCLMYLFSRCADPLEFVTIQSYLFLWFVANFISENELFGVINSLCHKHYTTGLYEVLRKNTWGAAAIYDLAWLWIWHHLCSHVITIGVYGNRLAFTTGCSILQSWDHHDLQPSQLVFN